MLQNILLKHDFTVMLESRTLVDAMQPQKPLVKKPVFGDAQKVTISSPPPAKKKRKKNI